MKFYFVLYKLLRDDLLEVMNTYFEFFMIRSCWDLKFYGFLISLLIKSIVYCILRVFSWFMIWDRVY